MHSARTFDNRLLYIYNNIRFCRKLPHPKKPEKGLGFTAGSRSRARHNRLKPHAADFAAASQTRRLTAQSVRFAAHFCLILRMACGARVFLRALDLELKPCPCGVYGNLRAQHANCLRRRPRPASLAASRQFTFRNGASEKAPRTFL